MQRLFEGRTVFFWTISGILLVGVLGVLDYKTGNELSFSLFYLIPISLAAWYAGPTLAFFISILSTLTWLAAELFVRDYYSLAIIDFWNTLIRLSFFLIVTYLLSKLRQSQTTIETLARTDHITGSANSRYFHELLGRELQRSDRYQRAFTLVYLDLDNFKQVNDQFGHTEGNELIKFIADELKSQIRRTDIVSRLGGDEFAILFPEAGQQAVEAIMSKIQIHLAERLSQTYPFVTFSAGAVTYSAAPKSIRETIKIADELMYSVKTSTKNGVRYSLYTSDNDKTLSSGFTEAK